jgi:hypothetical protein
LVDAVWKVKANQVCVQKITAAACLREDLDARGRRDRIESEGVAGPGWPDRQKGAGQEQAPREKPRWIHKQSCKAPPGSVK